MDKLSFSPKHAGSSTAQRGCHAHQLASQACRGPVADNGDPTRGGLAGSNVAGSGVRFRQGSASARRRDGTGSKGPPRSTRSLRLDTRQCDGSARRTATRRKRTAKAKPVEASELPRWVTRTRLRRKIWPHEHQSREAGIPAGRCPVGRCLPQVRSGDCTDRRRAGNVAGAERGRARNARGNGAAQAGAPRSHEGQFAIKSSRCSRERRQPRLGRTPPHTHESAVSRLGLRQTGRQSAVRIPQPCKAMVSYRREGHTPESSTSSSECAR